MMKFQDKSKVVAIGALERDIQAACNYNIDSILTACGVHNDLLHLNNDEILRVLKMKNQNMPTYLIRELKSIDDL